MERNIQGASYLDVNASASTPTGSAEPQLQPTPVLNQGNGVLHGEVNAVASPLADAAVTTPLSTPLPAGRPGIVLSGHGDEVCTTPIYVKNTNLRQQRIRIHRCLPPPLVVQYVYTRVLT